MKSLLVLFTFFLVFTVSLTPAALGAPDYPPTPSDSEDVNETITYSVYILACFYC